LDDNEDDIIKRQRKGEQIIMDRQPVQDDITAVYVLHVTASYNVNCNKLLLRYQIILEGILMISKRRHSPEDKRASVKLSSMGYTFEVMLNGVLNHKQLMKCMYIKEADTLPQRGVSEMKQTVTAYITFACKLSKLLSSYIHIVSYFQVVL
jgi:hypothetical protein